MAPKSSSPDGLPGAAVAVRVWDLPLRLFHWLLAAAVVGSVASAKAGNLDLHFWFGYGILALIAFRLVWGFIGPRYARFSSFLFSPAEVLRHLRSRPEAPSTLGHSPLGALSVFALLVIIGSQAVSGLFVSDEILTEGPLVRFASARTVEAASWWHQINERLIFALVGLHLAALLFYRVVKRISLVKPMIVGDKRVDAASGVMASLAARGSLAARDDLGVRLRALAIAVLAIGLVALVVNWPAG